MKVIEGKNGGLIKGWVDGVPIEDSAMQQLHNIASMPFIHKHVAVMPDVHWGMGATVGSVIPTNGVIIPAAVGVDLGCGMMAVKTTLNASDMPDNLHNLRLKIEEKVPHGRTDNGGLNDRGSWGTTNESHDKFYNKKIQTGLEKIVSKHPKIEKAANRAVNHLGTLGTGNHFIEICTDENQQIWIMLHSGSRGIGNRIGSYFIELAKQEMRQWFINLPDQDLAYLPEGSQYFSDYVFAVNWAQEYALVNREMMMEAAINSLKEIITKPFAIDDVAVNCHHNYVAKEKHFGDNVWVTRKGAVRISETDLGIIPGSMGAKSYIVKAIKGLALSEALCSCSHGAGRAMSRNEAKKRFTIQDHIEATKGVECRVDTDVIDETPMAYKDIDLVMAAQSDHVEIVHTLKQILCVKG